MGRVSRARLCIQAAEWQAQLHQSPCACAVACENASHLLELLDEVRKVGQLGALLHLPALPQR